MSWLFSQALAAEYSAASCLDGAPSAPSNTTPTPQAFLSRDKTTDAWSRFPSGMTCEPLTDDRGEALLKSYLAGFLVQTSVSPAKVRASKEKKAASGPKWPESLARLDRNTSSWKTRQLSLFADSDEFSETWPKWGIMLDGACWEQTPAELTITEPECGWLPTPTCADAKNAGGRQNQYDLSRHAREITGKRLNVHYSEWTMDWPIGWTACTPLAMDRWRAWLHSHGACSAGQQHKEAA